MAWADMANRMLGVAVRTFNEVGVVYTPAGGSPLSLMAVFDDAHLRVDPGTGAPISSTNPIMGIRNSDLPAAPRKGDTVLVRGVRYRVIEAQPDGVAGSLLELQEA